MKTKISLAVMLLMSIALLAIAPSNRRISNITTTQGTNYFLPVGYNTLVCNGWVHYKMVTTSTGTVATTDPMVKGDVHLPNKPVFINVASGTQYLALLLDNGAPATCSITQSSSDNTTGSFTTLAVSSTSVLTGIVTEGTVDAGATAVNGTLNVTGAVVLTGATLQNDGTTKLGLTDAGSIAITGTLNVAGDTIVASTKTRGNCTLNNASPSVCTATVNTGAICVCANNTTTTNDVKCAVSSTTLTITGPNTTTDVASYICLQ